MGLVVVVSLIRSVQNFGTVCPCEYLPHPTLRELWGIGLSAGLVRRLSGMCDEERGKVAVRGGYIRLLER